MICSLPSFAEAGKRIVQNKDNISEDKDKQYVENNLKNNHMIDNGPKKLKLIDTAATRDEDVPIVNKRQAIDKENSANKLVGWFAITSTNLKKR